jgi:hypothetical protein
MERYTMEIDIAGERVSLVAVARCVPDDDYTWYYDIYNGGALMGTITPKHDNSAQVLWVSADLITQEYAQKIGEEIERQDR